MPVDHSIVLFFPTAFESGHYRPSAGHTNAGDVTTCICGIGEAAGRTSNEWLARNHSGIKHALLAGFAGGINPALNIGDTCTVSPEEHPSMRIHCSPEILVRPEQKRRIWESTGAEVVEMEYTHVLAACRSHEIPLTVIRAISDTALETLPIGPINAAFDSAQNQMTPLRLLRYLTRNPHEINAFLQFVCAMAKTRRSLHKAIQHWLKSLAIPEPEARAEPPGSPTRR